MDISPATWNTLSKLLDEAFDLDAKARLPWLDRLDASAPELAPTLRKLLAAHATHETDDLLVRALAPPAEGEAAVEGGGLAAGGRVGPYRLVRELGSGGMADVWLAERADGAFAREMALKLPLVNRLRRDLAVRFMRERDILARLEHSHIARFYDAGIGDDGVAYMAMEFVDGEPLIAWCDAHRQDVPARLRLFAQVLDAVQYAHANLVIHRDLKPSNILVTADGQAHLLDFGIAKLLADEGAQETQLTRMAGRPLTPDYASPEQIKGEPLTIATDIYSLGVVLYELLAGQRPYRLKLQSAAQFEHAIVATDPPRPSTVAATQAAQARGVTAARLSRVLAGDLDTIVLKALAKAPAQRYLTVAELAADLRRHLDGEPVHARPASWTYRARKFVVRNRYAVGGATAIAVALIAAAVVSTWQAQRARDEAARAEAVKQFVLSFFGSADIDRGANRKMTAVDMLTQARERLSAAQIADVGTRVELLTTIGSGLSGFGDTERAIDVMEEATRLALGTLGDDHRFTAEARALYGRTLIDRGQPDLAERQFAAAEKTLRRLDDLGWLAGLLAGRSSVLIGRAEYERAVEVAQERVNVAERMPPPADRRVLAGAYRDLAGAMRLAGRKGAIEPAQRAYALARDLHGDRSTALLLSTQLEYASALADEGDPEVAVREMKAVLRRQIDMDGPDSPAAAGTLRRIGALSMAIGDPAAAVESFRAALRLVLAEAAGKPTPALAGVRVNLGSALANAHRYDDALDAWRQADLTYSTVFSPEHPGARLSRSGVALALTRLGKLGDAEAIFAALLARPFSNPSEEGFIKSRLAQLRIAQRRYAEAEALLRDEPARFAGASTSRPRALALAEYGDVLLAGGKAGESLPVLHEAQALLIKVQPNGSPDLADIALNVARASTALGQADQALAPAGEAVAYWRGLDPTGRDHGVALAWYARALAGSGNKSKAADVARQAAAVLAVTGLPGDRDLIARTRAALTPAK